MSTQPVVRQLTEAERHALITRLASVREELREARSTYHSLCGRIKEWIEFRNDQQQRIKHALEAINDWANVKPRIVDILPGDPESKAWRERSDLLQRYREEQTTILASVEPPPLLEAARYEGPTGTIATLEHAEASLIRQLDPHSDQYLKGGVFRVGP